MKRLCDCPHPAAGPSARAPLAARRTLWEVSPRHHCMLLGAAFDPRELREIFRRAGSTDCDDAGDYHLHSSAVHYAVSRNPFSVHAQRRIEARWRAAVWAFREVSDARDLATLWRAWAARGEGVEAYWAALTHPVCDPELEETLSSEIHMLSHELFAQRRGAARRVRALEDALRAAQGERDAVRERELALRREAARLREQVAAATLEAAAARSETGRAAEELERWRAGAQAAELQARLEAALSESRELRRELDRARRRLAREAARFRTSAKEPAPAALPVARPAHGPPRPDFGRSRVLCVGGKRNLVTLYRGAIEAVCGEFLYHDGGVEDRLSRLPALLGSADAVVCLSGDCSHGAVHAVKRYCKRFGKPCALLANSSVSAIAQWVERGFARTA